MCQRESGRVSTADIVECATRMRINMKRNLRSSLNGMSHLHFVRVVLTLCFCRGRFCDRCCLKELNATSQHDQNETCSQPHLRCRVICFAFFLYMAPVFNCAERSARPAAPCSSLTIEWMSISRHHDAIFVIVRLSVNKHVSTLKYKANIIGRCCHK